AGAADHPVVPEVAEDRVATVRDHGSGSGAAIARRLDAAGSGDAAVVRVEVQEVLVGRRRGAGLPDSAVRVEQDRAAWVVLVVEQELAAATTVRHVPGVAVGTEVQD